VPESRESKSSVGRSSRGSCAPEEIDAIFAGLVEHAGEAIALFEEPAGRDGESAGLRLLRANRAFFDLAGRSPEEAIDHPLAEVVPDSADGPLADLLAPVADGSEPLRRELYIERWDRHLSLVAFAPQSGLLATVFTDRTAGKRMEQDLRLRTAYFEELFERSPLGIVLLDNEDRIIDSNRGFEELFGFTKGETLGRKVNSLIVRPGRDEEASVLSTRVLGGEVLDVERVRQHKDGRLVDVRILAHPVHLDEEQIAIYGIYSDISHQKRDLLTGLPNRMSFAQLLESEEIHIASSNKGLSAVLVILILGLRDFNDTYGLQAGDHLLIAVAERLRARLEEREGTVPARIGSNKYAVLQLDLVDVGSAEGLARRLLTEFARPFRVGDREVHVGASIGVALAVPDTDPDRLLRQAERAARRALAESPNSFGFHTSDMDDDVRSRMSMGQRLYGALDREELKLDYQLQVDLDSGEHGLFRICGVEALLRWRDGDGRPIAGPSEFIPVAEATGQIVRIGEWVLRSACAQARAWNDETGLDIPVAVNLSPVQFKDEQLLDKVRGALQASGLPHRLLELEITERLLMEPTPHVKRTLERLAELGVRFALDDFGKGHSSWGYLRRDDLSLGKIKIDKSILDGLESTERDAALLSVMATLGRKLGVTVCAEGVERPRQIEFLVAEGCHQAQGFLLSRPVGPVEVRRLLRRGMIRLDLSEEDADEATAQGA
jgi:Amt family ammonium transporter